MVAESGCTLCFTSGNQLFLERPVFTSQISIPFDARPVARIDASSEKSADTTVMPLAFTSSWLTSVPFESVE